MEIKNKRTLGFKCDKCDTEFKFDASDIKKDIFWDNYIRCPICKKKHELGSYNFKDLIDIIELRDVLEKYIF